MSVIVDGSSPADDLDGDGYGTSGADPDCDDTQVATYPGAEEIYDGADNNCNIFVDEATDGYDDDGDASSEADGDCNDTDSDVYPGAPERGDGADNDCDGLVDEGTQLYDDDGDGYAEVDDDCDDTDAAVYPGALEECDGDDDDCDSLVDDACVAGDSPPVVIGDIIRMSRNAAEVNDVVELEIRGFDADGQGVLTYSWTDDCDNAFDYPTASRVHWRCSDAGEGGGNKTLYATILDPDGHQAWAFTKLALYPEGGMPSDSGVRMKVGE